ncbi:MAG TPA: peptidoglycan DD-metalloendopeptidase family protein [Bacillota bacterium]|nr:peptidoglycan DD-metalloendopeptidase family protein [Bacillota bacterium]
MERFLRRSVVILLLGSALFSLGLFPINGATSEEQNQIEKLIEKTQRDITTKKQQEKSVLNNLHKQQKELTQLESNYNRIKGQLNTIQNKVNLTKQELQILQSNLIQLEQNLKNRKQLLNQRLVIMYKYGVESYSEILFNSRDFTDLLNRYDAVAYFVKHDLNLLDEIKSVKAVVSVQHQKVQAKSKEVESQYRQIVNVKNQVAQSQKKMLTKVQLTQREYDNILTDRVKLEKALDEYEETSRQIAEEIRKREQKNGQEILGTGNMIWPVRGRLSSSFGWRVHPVLKTKKYHNGQDIAVPKGTSVKAADDGIVVVSGNQGGYGLFIAIDHGAGISTCYGHNSRLLVSVGEKVTKGQVIAKSGSTGLSTGPHVHFEVRIQGVPVNPLPYLP